MNRSLALTLATLACAAAGLASAQTATPSATDSTDMAASGTHGKRMKHSGSMKKDGMAKHEASDQNTARSSGATASGPSPMKSKGGTSSSGMAASGTRP